MSNLANVFSIVPVEVCLDKRLTLEQLRVLVAIFSFRNKNTDVVWPSRQQISERCGMHPSNISAATTALVEYGWLVKDGKGGFSKSTRYTITVPETVAEQATVAQSATVAEQATRPVAESATRMGVAEQATRKEHNQELTNGTNQKGKVRFDPLCIELPSCIPSESWAEWIAYRRQRKLATSKATAEKQIARLAEWHKSGHDPTKIIAESIANGWQGLFEPKSNVTRTVHDERKEWLDKALGKRNERDITAHATRLD